MIVLTRDEQGLQGTGQAMRDRQEIERVDQNHQQEKSMGMKSAMGLIPGVEGNEESMIAVVPVLTAKYQRQRVLTIEGNLVQGKEKGKGIVNGDEDSNVVIAGEK